MPRARRRCSRPDCDNVAPCPTHVNTRRPPRQARGYDAHHEKRAAKLRETAERLELPCHLCDGTIDYRLRAPHPRSFAAHHLTRDKRNGPLAPTHKRCNEIANEPGWGVETSDA